MRGIVGIALVGLVGAAALMAVVRLVPLDPAVWHQPVPEVPGEVRGEVAASGPVLVSTSRGALAYWPAGKTAPGRLLADVARFAATQPRTRLLAGSVAEGRISWVQRSAFWGFPDVITAETTGAGLRLWSRQRDGRSDFGVNAARLALWLRAS